MLDLMPNDLFLPFAVALACVSLVAWLGIVLTDLGPWYRSLKQPAWKPADKWFGPIWSTIFLLMAMAMALAWVSATTPLDKALLAGAFLLNCVLNVLWNLLFFAWRRPDWAQWEVIALWASIVALMLAFASVHPWAYLLLAPYLAWVTAAGLLNRQIVRANGPFDIER